MDVEPFQPTTASDVVTHGRSSKRVLIVDGSADSREVLAYSLARCGVTTLTTSGPREAQQVLRELVPDLVVVDADTVRADATSETWEEPSDVRCLVLDSTCSARKWGTAEKLGAVEGQIRQPLPHSSETASQLERFAKPYHYRPLIRKIVQMLDESDAA